MSEGTRNSLRFVTESAWGTPSGTAYTILRKIGDAGISVDRSSIRSEEVNARRAITALRLGNKLGKVQVPFELSYATVDSLLESAFFAAWVAAGTASASLTATVVAGTTNTIGATGIGTGIVAGDWIKVSGFTAGNVGNNGYFKVTTRAADLLTLGEAKDASGASLLTACSSIANVVVQRMGYLLPGTTMKSLTFEEAQEDIPLFMQARGAVADVFSLNIQPDAIVKGNFDFLSKTFANPQGSAFSSTQVAANTNEVMQSNDAYSYLSLDGAPVNVVTGLDFSMKNGVASYFAVLSGAEMSRMGKGDSDLTGSMTLFLDSTAYWLKYLSEVPMALTVKLLDPANTHGYAFDFPKIKFTGANVQRGKDNVIQTLPFQALEEATQTIKNVKLWRLV